jgi:single-stranded-DNA-specific exonuclease
MKKWEILNKFHDEDIVQVLLKNRGLNKKQDIENFLNPGDPSTLTSEAVEIDAPSLHQAIQRIKKAIEKRESIVVYADYDADGITAGAIMWEALHELRATVMPYIPHRVDEGYGLSKIGIDNVVEQYHSKLIITVDHGISGKEKVDYAKSLGIDVIITDHHVKSKDLPDCTIVHTTKLCGAGVSWFLAKELTPSSSLELAAIGTIADMVPLVGPNRAIVKHGLEIINKTNRVGLNALVKESGLTKGELSVFDVSHVLAPRLNAMGRLEHALDALRLLCTHRKERAMELAQKLGLTNKERQQLTVDTTAHALEIIKGTSLFKQGSALGKKLIFLAHESYNQGVIGLVAGKLVEEHYLPTIVVSKGELISKASARSISGFNIVEAIRQMSDILIDVGGHPMAAGFTVETKNLGVLQDRLEKLAEKELDEEKLTRVLKVDAEIPLEFVTEELWRKLQDFQPFGFGNPEPVFATRDVKVKDARLVGSAGKHLKLRLQPTAMEAIAFNFGSLYGKLQPNAVVDIAYSINRDTWNGNSRLQLKIKDIQLSQ